MTDPFTQSSPFTKKRASQSSAGMRSRVLLIGLLIFCVMQLTACGPYQLRGSVVQGDRSGVWVVHKDDSRLKKMTLQRVSVEVTLDPSSMSPKQLGVAQTDVSGQFDMIVDAMGAGSWQEYDLGILVRHEGYRDLWQTLEMPPRDKRLLIVISPGKGGNLPPTDILKESMELKDKFMEN